MAPFFIYIRSRTGKRERLLTKLNPADLFPESESRFLFYMKSTKKTNQLPDFKHCPVPPKPVKKSEESTIKEIVDLLSSHSPVEQNNIVIRIMATCMHSRYEEYENARESERNAGMNFEKFMSTVKEADGILKATVEAKSKANA